MKKWYAPCAWMLLAAMSAQLVGCASTSRTISQWTGRDKGDDQVAAIDGRADKPSKEDVKIAGDTKSKAKPGTSTKPKPDSQLADAGARKSKDSVAAKPTTKQPVAADSQVAGTSKRPSRDQIEGSIYPTRGKDAAETSKQAADEDPFAGFALSDFEDANLAPPPKKPVKDAARESSTNAVAANQQSPIGTAKLSNGVLKPPSANGQVAQGTQKLTPRVPQVPAGPKPASQREIAQAKADSGLPEWALDETAVATNTPAIAQTAATRIQPGQPAPATTKPTQSPRAAAGVTQKPTVPPPKTTGPKLSALCPDAQGEVRELVKTLDTNDVETLKRGIHRLGRMQTHAAAAKPALEALLKHPDGFVRVHAALALVRLNHVDTEVTETLIVGLRSPDPGIRSFAAAVLAEMGPHSADALPALSAALHDTDGYVRLHVAEVLIRHGEWSHAALASLNDCLSNNDENVRWLATYSLAELAPQSEDAVGALTRTLRDPVSKVQVGAAYALGEIGPMAASATTELERCLVSPDSELKSAAEYALTQIRP